MRFNKPPVGTGIFAAISPLYAALLIAFRRSRASSGFSAMISLAHSESL